jgi:hypothetical protein
MNPAQLHAHAPLTKKIKLNAPLTVRTHQGHGCTRASAFLLQGKKLHPPNCFLTSGSHAIVNSQ